MRVKAMTEVFLQLGSSIAGKGKRLGRVGAAALAFVANFIVPPHCLLCRRPSQAPASLCAECWGRLRFIDDPCCPRLGIPFPYDSGPGQVSAAALADPPPWSRARAAIAYDDASREIVHALKYRDRHEAGILMSRLMAGAGSQLIADAELVVPVPLHRWRLWQRRFNQAAILARRLCADSPKRFQPLALMRARPTRPQVGLDHEARQKNVRGAFLVPDERTAMIAGRRVLLIDDVMTTGATARACTAALLRAGASDVDVLTFALVLEPRRLHI
jgi:ComF family protein